MGAPNGAPVISTSTISSTALTYEESSEARKSAALATSSGSPQRPSEFLEISGQGREELLAVFRNGDGCAVAMHARSKFGDCLIERLLIVTVMATCAPSAMKRRAVARPIPLLPPVISAFLPVSLYCLRFCMIGIKHDGCHTCAMMTIIDGGCRKNMRYPVKETAAKHERILREASRLFRERGFANVTVGEVMKAAGLTHGAFYAHFDSKEELQAAAIAYGQKVSLGRVQHSKSKRSKRSYVERYLSAQHRDNPGDGCTMAALASEVARSTPELKAPLEQGFEEIISASGGDRKEAIFRLAAMMGGVVLARAVQHRRLSDEILGSVRQKLG